MRCKNNSSTEAYQSWKLEISIEKILTIIPARTPQHVRKIRCLVRRYSEKYVNCHIWPNVRIKPFHSKNFTSKLTKKKKSVMQNGNKNKFYECENLNEPTRVMCTIILVDQLNLCTYLSTFLYTFCVRLVIEVGYKPFCCFFLLPFLQQSQKTNPFVLLKTF